jgi:hypothetical protein
MARILSGNNKKLVPKGLTVLLVTVFFIFNTGILKAQDNNYQLGVRGGVGMSTLNGYQNNGLKVGLTVGGFGKYFLNENMSIIADIDYSMGGQQSERWITNNRDELKEYRKYRLHYINIPVLYQYYFTDILGLEAGFNMRYCIAGNLKTKIGNDSWKSAKLDHNNFDCGLIFGVYTDNLIPNEDFFVSLRAYFGFIDVVKEVGSNKNISIQVTVGYTIF